MNLEEFKKSVRVHVQQQNYVHHNWESVLDALKKLDPNDGNYYMITVDKGTADEARTRFLSYTQAYAYATEQIFKKVNHV